MAASTKLIALGLGALIMCSIMVGFADATLNDNGVLKHNKLACNQRGPNGCLGPPANPYQRGCGVIEKCKRSPEVEEKDIVGQATASTNNP